MNKPLVSIVVPMFNVEKYISRCLDSILNQTYNKIEILCVDDCSPDDSSTIVKEYCKKNNNISLLSYETNKGLGGARDYGIHHAKGEYIMFIDSDDYIQEDYVSTYVDALNDDTDIVIGSYVKELPDNSTKVMKIPSTINSPWLYGSACIRLYSLNFLKENNIDFRGIRVYEDSPFNIRCMCANPKIKFIDYAGYFYSYNANSITKTVSVDKIENRYYSSIQNLNNLFKDIELTKNNYQIVEYHFISESTIGLLYNLKGLGKTKVKDFYNARKQCLQLNFPKYLKNKYIRFWKLPEGILVNRIVINCYIIAERFHLEKPFLYFIARKK